MKISNRKEMKLGLGEAIKRINRLHVRVSSGLSSLSEKEELSLLMEALNEIEIDLGFDCNDDGVADTIEIFAQTAKTSCCRLTPTKGKSSSRSDFTEERKTSSRRKSSRKKTK